MSPTRDYLSTPPRVDGRCAFSADGLVEETERLAAAPNRRRVAAEQGSPCECESQTPR